MLDEIKEFKQYTTLPNEYIKSRLKYHSLIKKGELSGLERAMTIVARGFIFNENAGTKFDDAKIKECLKAWCGFRTTEAIDAKNWLKKYIRQEFLEPALLRCINAVKEVDVDSAQKSDMLNFLNIENLLSDISIFRDEKEQKSSLSDKADNNATNDFKTSLNSIEDLEKVLKKAPALYGATKIDIGRIKHSLLALTELSEKNKTYSKGIFSAAIFQKDSDNDVKAITYESIIADALNLGRLETYFLVYTGKDDPFDSNLIKKQTDKNPLPVLSANSKNGMKTKYLNARDLILKITAGYLLQKIDTEQEYVYFNQTDMKNWLVLEKPDIGGGKDGLITFTYGLNEEPLFSLNTITRNVSKIKLHPGWIKNFRLVKSDFINNPDNRGFTYYIDQGSRTYLLKRIIE